MRNKLRALKTLAWYKELKEEQAKATLLQAKQVYQILLKEKENLIKEKEEAFKGLENKKVLTAEELKTYLEILEVFFVAKEELETKIKTQEREIDLLLEALKNAYQEKRVAEILRDKTYRLFYEEGLKNFYRQMDDLMVIRRGK
ncbi:hypothetical protein F1847_02295 [Thermodesulfobacterium sp. TA1]|uniref:hypothetical protein n=1 Tax=Thermodesulfobacterium sp. TA1 TaxID=2234087 RepID=UPI0012325EA9|nr:hypothetical protein [Thermodesulfobacterium sp. TA1]QER41630.1 hypothetical protein F1847_02295 [Thermodesulfobacterium sp. TA1]